MVLVKNFILFKFNNCRVLCTNRIGQKILLRHRSLIIFYKKEISIIELKCKIYLAYVSC